MKLSTTALTLVTVANALTAPQHQSLLGIGGDDPLKVPGQNPMNYCNDPTNYILQVHHLDLNPNPPVPGKPLNIKAIGSLSETINKGSEVHVVVKINRWVQLLSKDFDICDNAGVFDKECPIDKGHLNVTKEVDMPRSIPPGTYIIEAEAYTKDSKQITCMKGEVTFGLG